MHVLLDGQGDGPVWSGNGNHRDFDAAVITPQRGVLVSRHDRPPSFLGPPALHRPSWRDSWAATLACFISGGPVTKTVSNPCAVSPSDHGWLTDDFAASGSVNGQSAWAHRAWSACGWP